MKDTMRVAVMAIAIILTVCIVSTPADATDADIWNGTSIDTDWYDQESNSYTISTASELAGLAFLVNDGNSFSGITIKLMADINLNGKNWIPIGTETSKFMGSFVGTDFKISNLYINDDTLEYAGLFGVLASPGSITDVTIENANVTAMSSVGALVGSAYTGTVSECEVMGAISITGYYKVGGLTGEGYATIDNCHVSGSSGSTVTGKYLEADLEGDNVGGLIGFRGEGTIQTKYCSVSGIAVDGTRKVGGLVGSAYDDNTISECSVTGVTVNSSATSDYIQDNLSSMAIGGLIGLYTHNGDGNGVLENCTATDVELSGDPDVVKNYIAGGIRGTAEVEPISDSMKIADNRLDGSYSGATAISFIRDGSAYPTVEAALDGVTEDVTLYIIGGEYGMFQTDDDFEFDHKVTFQSLNGANVTIRIVPSSGCGNTTNHTCLIDGETHNGINTDCPLNWSTPQRIQDYNAQYQIFNGFTDVAFSGIDFVFVPSDFTLCINSEWKGTADKESVLNAEFQFKNTGDLSFTDCSFDRVIVSPFSSRGTTTITGCTFSEVYDAYAIKDIYSINAVIEDCDFTDCGGAIYFEGNVPKGEYTIRNNTFTDIDTEEWAEAGKAGSRGLIQFSANGDYSNSFITVEGNESTGDTAVFRQLNQTITSGILDADSISAENDFDGEMFTSSSQVIDVNTIYLDTTVSESGNGTADSPVNTFEEALALVNAGGTIVVSGELRAITGIDKPVTILGSEDEPVSVTGSLEIPNVNGTVRFVNLHFNGGNCIADYSNSDLSNLSLVFENCSFNNSGHTLYIQSTIHSLTLTDCVFTTDEDVQVHSYLVWTYRVDELTVTGCKFNGNGNVRGAIHPGDGSESGTTVSVENTVFDGYERGLNLAFTNEDVSNEVSITGCTFNDIADNPDDTAFDDTHTATIYIHQVQKPDTTTITYSNNKINGGSGHVFYSNNPVLSAQDLVDDSTFTGNTLDGETIDDLGSVCLDPWLVEVDGYGYRTLDEAIQSADEDSTITLLKDVAVPTRIGINTDVTLDLGGFSITSSEDYSVSDGMPYLITVEGASVTIENGTLLTTSANTHGLNVYGGEATIRNVTIDVSNSSEEYCAPLIVNGSDVTLGGEVMFRGGTYYSINLDSAVSGVDEVSLTTEKDTSLSFYGVPLGIYNEMDSEQTAEVNFGSGTVYYYDMDPFILLGSENESSESVPNEATDSKQEYEVTFNITPSFSVVTVYQDGKEIVTVSGNGVTSLLPGSYTFISTATGYDDLEKDFEVRGVTVVSGTMIEGTLEPEPEEPGTDPDTPVVNPPYNPGSDDGDYIPPSYVIPEQPSNDDDTVTIVACAAAAAVAAILAVFLILDRKR